MHRKSSPQRHRGTEVNRKILTIDPFDYPAMRTPISLALFFCVILAGFAIASGQDLPLTEIYRVGAGDVLDIRLLNAANRNSTLFTVDGGGVIDLPVAGGNISVGGLTTEEIQKRIAAELKRRAVEENAKVSVGVRQYLSHSVTVTGLVIHPGTRFLRRERVPLYVVLAESQLRNDGGRVMILREGSAGEPHDLSDPSTMNLIVQPGDVITVTSRPQ